MRKLIAINQVTLDGIMQAPGGPEEDASGRFDQGGWAMPFWDDSLGEALTTMMSGEFSLLLGRRTYDVFAGYWPKAGDDNPIAKPFNRALKYVVTNTPSKTDWITTHRIEGDVVAGIDRLKGSEGPELHLWGSHQLLQTLTGAGLVDEYRLLVYPVVLGRGKRLFEAGSPPRHLTLLRSHSTPKGVLVNTYASLPPR